MRHDCHDQILRAPVLGRQIADRLANATRQAIGYFCRGAPTPDPQRLDAGEGVALSFRGYRGPSDERVAKIRAVS